MTKVLLYVYSTYVHTLIIVITRTQISMQTASLIG